MEWWGGIEDADYSPYVRDYFLRVIAADVAAGNTQGLEKSVRDAYSVAIEGLVSDGLLGVSGGVISQAASRIKAMCFMCGARTLSGCLVPVVGPAPTNFNFGSGDYSRKTGLQGSTSTSPGKYLHTNVDNSSSLYGTQNNKHLSVYVPTTSSTFTKSYLIGGNSSIGVATSLATYCVFANNSSGQPYINTHALNDTAFPFIGTARNASTEFMYRARGANGQSTGRPSAVPTAGGYVLFANAALTSFTSCQISVYTVGEYVDLALLEARFISLAANLAIAIP